MGSTVYAIIGVIGATLTVSPAFGSERELDAHQHGHGVLNIAIEDKTLWIELEAPGADIVGFEHPVSSREDKVAVEAAKTQLGDPISLFGIPPNASCSLDDIAVVLIGDRHEGNGDDHVDHATAEDSADHHDNHTKEETRHTEFHAEYKMRCADLEEIETLPLRYFAVFPAAQELDVSVITEGGQYRQKVTRRSPMVQLTGD